MVKMGGFEVVVVYETSNVVSPRVVATTNSHLRSEIIHAYAICPREKYVTQTYETSTLSVMRH
jgi:hypothetical protein